PRPDDSRGEGPGVRGPQTAATLDSISPLTLSLSPEYRGEGTKQACVRETFLLEIEPAFVASWRLSIPRTTRSRRVTTLSIGRPACVGRSGARGEVSRVGRLRPVRTGGPAAASRGPAVR